LVWDEGFPEDGEADEIGEEEGGIEPGLDGGDGGAGSVEGEWAPSFFEPETLDEEGEAADMIAVLVGEDDPVEGIGAQTQGGVGTGGAIAAIDEHVFVAELVEVGGVPTIRAGPTLPDAEAGDVMGLGVCRGHADGEGRYWKGEQLFQNEPAHALGGDVDGEIDMVIGVDGEL
jgi:hypothetical protein